MFKALIIVLQLCPFLANAQRNFEVQAESSDLSEHPRVMVVATVHDNNLSNGSDSGLTMPKESLTQLLADSFHNESEPVVFLLEGFSTTDQFSRRDQRLTNSAWGFLKTAPFPRLKVFRGHENFFLNYYARIFFSALQSPDLTVDDITHYQAANLMRSHYMARSIKTAVQEYPQSRIVLMAGALHGLDGVIASELRAEKIPFQVRMEEPIAQAFSQQISGRLKTIRKLLTAQGLSDEEARDKIVDTVNATARVARDHPSILSEYLLPGEIPRSAYALLNRSGGEFLNAGDRCARTIANIVFP